MYFDSSKLVAEHKLASFKYTKIYKRIRYLLFQHQFNIKQKQEFYQFIDKIQGKLDTILEMQLVIPSFISKTYLNDEKCIYIDDNTLINLLQNLER